MDRYETEDALEVLERSVKPFGSGGAHITVPKRWIGTDVKIVRVSEPEPDSDE